MDGIKKLLKLAVVAAIVVAGVQFSLVYINRLQLKNIMDAEGLDGRRAKSSAADIEKRIRDRAASTNIRIPEGVEFTIEGTGGGDNDLWITADYVDEVNLFVYKHPWPMHIESNAAPPVK